MKLRQNFRFPTVPLRKQELPVRCRKPARFVGNLGPVLKVASTVAIKISVAENAESGVI